MKDVEDRVQLTKLLLDIDRKETLDLAQKAKIKWAIEGMKIVSIFMGLLKKRKRRHLAIRGILIDGVWIEDSIRVKCEFYNHFASRFDVSNWLRPKTMWLFLGVWRLSKLWT